MNILSYFTDKKLDYKQIALVLLLLFVLLIPNIVTLYFSKDLANSYSTKIAYFILSLFLYLFWMAIIGIKNTLKIGFLFLLFAPTEIIFVKSVGSPINEGFIESILNTNINETYEQIKSNIYIVISYFFLVIIYIFLLRKVKTNRLKKPVNFGIIGTFFLVNTLVFMQMYNLVNVASPNDSKSQKLDSAYWLTFQKYQKIYPANIIINTYKTLKLTLKISQLNKDVNSFSFDAKISIPNNKEEIFVLVIGETARYNNFHINGYKRETTPELDKLENLYSFNNVYSAATYTSLSVPQIITRATPENFDLQFKEKSVAEAFKEAGYYTAWIGNQSQENMVVKRLSKNLDFAYFSQQSSKYKNDYDMNTLDQLKNVLSNHQNKKKFIVVHSMGSHFRYSNRYPKEFRKFSPTISETGYESITYNNKEELVNSYDNSILYTDYFLSNIIKLLKEKNTNTTLLYTSDHGENLYDDSRKIIFHGTENPTKFEYHIPYFVWTSEKYKLNNPDKIKAIETNINKKASSTSTFYTLLDMANISYKDSSKDYYKSLSNTNYTEPKTRKIITGSKKVLNVD